MVIARTICGETRPAVICSSRRAAPTPATSIIFIIFIEDDVRSLHPATDSIPG
ncbi:hypothetical protein NLM27_42680 [Bradyrhizobium sp. CCGB12]|uniref:hypothetical protein n=1 Tax=Bradyrhizobium sp. CCGB12 TaxID=2949632 RepID=UPI0020B19874|nr:hypothetical protein [Bradyrhizobium sp. CCGB12]MCP3395422.1 hypothetical protein [Bradyrhizobium sp. CCGB12]